MRGMVLCTARARVFEGWKYEDQWRLDDGEGGAENILGDGGEMPWIE
jgi:hypothetical protein